MKILVTGGAGFIGSNFIYYMLAGAPRRSNCLSGQPYLCRKYADTQGCAAK